MARLLREARAAASIKSEHVARVLDVGTLPSGAPFIVMEHLEGIDLDTLLVREGPRAVPEAVDFILQACEAIAEAHRNGIVHRDLKPANLFIARLPGGASKLKVVDFGISKSIGTPALESLTDPSRVVGSLYHMAPEQMRGMPVDARTDVWAIGVVLFELLTGRKPFREGAWPAVCAQVLNETAPALGVIGTSVPEGLDAIVQRCLRRAPHDRYPNVAELAVALSAFGTASARSSLEQIVRLATSTGSLSADTIPPPPTDSAREISSVEPVAAPSPGESQRSEPTVVAASPPRVAQPQQQQQQPAPTPATDLRRDRRWRVAATAAIAAIAIAFWLAPAAERPAAPAEPRTNVAHLAPNVSPVQQQAPAPSASAPSPEPAVSSAATTATVEVTLPLEPAATAAPEPRGTQVAPVPVAAATSPPPVASPARALAPPTSTSPRVAAPAPGATSTPAPDTKATEAPPAAATATPAAPKAARGSAWDLSDIEFKELPE
jgi:serine/threonine-protein kinase